MLQDDQDALYAALSFVDAFLSSDEVSPGHVEGSTPEESEDDALEALLPTGASTLLPSPLSPLKINFGLLDTTALNEKGRLRGGCRASMCEAVPSTPGKTKRRKKVNPNRARNERKNELAYLRSKVRQLETELNGLRSRYRTGNSTTQRLALTPLEESAPAVLASDTTAPLASGLPPFWRDMATRQRLRRDKSERENARLKLVLESQVKLAQSLEALLKKRAKQQLSECEGCVADKSGSQGRTLDFLADKSTFETLLASVDAAYCELDEVFSANGLLDSESPSRDACMREGINGMFLDISSNKLLPFSKQAVATAVWNHFKGGEKHRGNLYEKAAKELGTTADTIMEDFKMEFLGKTSRADFRVKQVLRRYEDVEHDREVVVWVTSVHSLDENKPRPFAGLGFAEKGYVVIKRPTSPALLEGGYSMLQMCSLVVPQKTERCVQDASAVGAFTEFVLNVIAANVTTSQEMIENGLLDDALGHSADSRHCS